MPRHKSCILRIWMRWRVPHKEGRNQSIELLAWCADHFVAWSRVSSSRSIPIQHELPQACEETLPTRFLGPVRPGEYDNAWRQQIWRSLRLQKSRRRFEHRSFLTDDGTPPPNKFEMLVYRKPEWKEPWSILRTESVDPKCPQLPMQKSPEKKGDRSMRQIFGCSYFLSMRLTINRRNSYLLGVGSSNFSFLPILAGFVYEIVQKCWWQRDKVRGAWGQRSKCVGISILQGEFWNGWKKNFESCLSKGGIWCLEFGVSILLSSSLSYFSEDAELILHPWWVLA